MSARQLPIIIVLGSTQTLAWASSYYIAAVFADAIAGDLATSSTAFFAAFCMALLIAAALGPVVGRTIDAIGGQTVLRLSNVAFAAGLTVLACAGSVPTLWLAWLLLGAGMGLGLYDAAFATLGRIYGSKARPAITGITLIAGFASTIGWPLSAWGASTIGWRHTALAWAAAHIFLALPLNRFCLPTPPCIAISAGPTPRPHIAVDRTMAAHLPRLLQAAGASSVQAIAAGTLIGPAQVAARLVEAALLRRYHPLVSARLAAVAHPIGAAVFLLIGPAAASAFALLHGAGNGILTIARGTVPLAIFGPDHYGYRLGLLGAPAGPHKLRRRCCLVFSSSAQ